ncbi:MAG TPA: hypothetical protein VKR30_05520 [Candidatus Limnocylindrales bacterium]|nr:hypothetical protein [Candidatus Limnocylindrales bacterium]
MNVFIVEVENRAGQLSRIVTALGSAGVNITTGAGLGLSDSGGFGFVTDDENGARQALNAASIMFKTVPVVGAMVPNAAGGLAQAARKLAGAGVNVQFVAPMAMRGQDTVVVFGVDDAAAAKAALGELAADV